MWNNFLFTYLTYSLKMVTLEQPKHVAAIYICYSKVLHLRVTFFCYLFPLHLLIRSVTLFSASKKTHRNFLSNLIVILIRIQEAPGSMLCLRDHLYWASRLTVTNNQKLQDATFHMGEFKHKYRARCILFKGLKLQTWRHCVSVRLHMTKLNLVKRETFWWKLCQQTA